MKAHTIYKVVHKDPNGNLWSATKIVHAASLQHQYNVGTITRAPRKRPLLVFHNLYDAQQFVAENEGWFVYPIVVMKGITRAKLQRIGRLYSIGELTDQGYARERILAIVKVFWRDMINQIPPSVTTPLAPEGTLAVSSVILHEELP